MSNETVETVLWKAVICALRECIDCHGPISKRYLTSATKRIVRNILTNDVLIKVAPDDVKILLRQASIRVNKKQRKEDERNKILRRLRIELKKYREK